MDTLLAEFHSQIDELSDLLTLQLMPAPAGPASSPEDLPALLVAHVATLAARVEDLRAAVADEYAAIASAEDLKLKLDVQRAHMEHMLANIPESLPLPEPEPEPQPEVPKPKKKGRGGAENADPNNSGLLARKPRSGLAATARPAKDEKRTVALLTQAEFDGLPRYMLGRLTLEKWVVCLLLLHFLLSVMNQPSFALHAD